jgi:DNA sulfur modification protein DndE
MSLETIKLSEQAKEQLIRLKRSTGIKNWNVLCRWAFCVSLAEPTVPAPAKIPADSSVEMSWKVFGGPDHELYLALLKQRCHKDGFALTDTVLSTQFRLHLHRGIGYLIADKSLKDIASLIKKASTAAHEAIVENEPFFAESLVNSLADTLVS